MSKSKAGKHDALRQLLTKAKNNLNSCQVVKGKRFDSESYIQSCLRFPVSPEAQFLQKSIADELLDAGQIKEAARCYTQYQALTFKQQFLQQLTKRNHKTLTDLHRGKLSRDAKIQESLTETEKQIVGMMDDSETSLDDQLDNLPKDWTLVQISCYTSLEYTRFKTTKQDKAMKEGSPNLVLLRLSNDGSDPLIRKAIAPKQVGTVPYLLELQNVLEELILVLKKPGDNKTKYWNLRKELNDRMDCLVKSAETSWLGSVKSMLLGKLPRSTNKIIDEVYSEVTDLLGHKCQNENDEARIKLMLSAAKYLDKEQVFTELFTLHPDVDENDVSSAANLILQYSESKLDFESLVRYPVILILDSDLQPFPWESLPCMTRSKQAASRVPSLQYLSTMWKFHEESTLSIVNSGVSQESVFYMINPDKSLPKTQERLEGVMKGHSSWEGIFGEPPKPGQLANMLSKKDAYIYSGHGDGSIFMSIEEVKKLKIRSVPILLGCRSAELARYGRNLDPVGIAQSYLVGCSPAIAGFLWPVTDGDVDQWTVEFLEYWMQGKQLSLLQAIADKRAAFKSFVNSAALVVYGFPISLKSDA